ncbi:MAG: hypothetical protein BMS9Abin29_1723 [Gemmatimonadota bacterium]|nr:MAG: hypothetical protein BMS9Abin29_1723 [Gemmatimonadota bacterium]
MHGSAPSRRPWRCGPCRGSDGHRQGCTGLSGAGGRADADRWVDSLQIARIRREGVIVDVLREPHARGGKRRNPVGIGSLPGLTGQPEPSHHITTPLRSVITTPHPSRILITRFVPEAVFLRKALRAIELRLPTTTCAPQTPVRSWDSTVHFCTGRPPHGSANPRTRTLGGASPRPGTGTARDGRSLREHAPGRQIGSPPWVFLQGGEPEGTGG